MRCSPKHQRSPGFRDGLSGLEPRQLVTRIRLTWLRLQDEINLTVIEAGHRHIEIAVKLDQIGKFQGQGCFVPSRELSQTIVRYCVSAKLSLAEMGQADNRNRGDTKLARGLNPAVTSYDTVAIIDEHRIDEPERPDAVRKLSNLLLRMRSARFDWRHAKFLRRELQFADARRHQPRFDLQFTISSATRDFALPLRFQINQIEKIATSHFRVNTLKP